MNVLLSTFGVGVLSALIPVINLEAYLVGMALLIATHGVLTIPMSAAAGQVVGKLAWYEAGRSSVRLAVVQRTLESPKFGRMLTRLHALMNQRMWFGVLLLALSSVVGLPPLAVMAVLVGQAKFPRLLFAVILLAGRTLRFTLLLRGVSVLSDLFGK